LKDAVRASPTPKEATPPKEPDLPSHKKSGGRSLAQAIVTALVLIGLVVGFYALGSSGFFILICAAVLLALYELLDALRKSGRRPVITFGVLCGFGMLSVAYLERPAYFGVVVAATVFGSLLLSLRPKRGASPASDAAWTILGVLWIGGGGAAATAMTRLEPGGLDLLVAMVGIVAADDIAAYFAGTTFGKHKMAPSISPAKSWEGFAGGMLTALGAGVVASLLLDELTLLHGLDIALIVGLLDPVGDLVESSAKREIGIKDSSGLLPGHGGMLDRLDAIIFCAPAVYLYLRFIVF
jgi:phosphatidate cytidylyltransferase